nr:hypothetical protein [Devosia insulae]
MSPIAAIRLIFFLDGLIIAKWLPHLPDIQVRLGLDVGELGLALAALPLGIMASLPLVGTFVTSRLSERAAIRLTFAWLALTSVLPGLAWDLPSFAIALFFFGSGIAGVEVAMNATADAIETRLGKRIMSSCHGLWSVGNLTGAALGSLALAFHLEENLTLTVAAPVLLALAYVSTRQLGHNPISSAPGPALALPDLPLLMLCLLPFCACVLEGAMADWAAVYLRTEHGAQAAHRRRVRHLRGDHGRHPADRRPADRSFRAGLSRTVLRAFRPARADGDLGGATCLDGVAGLCADGLCCVPDLPDLGNGGSPTARPFPGHEHRRAVVDLLFRLRHRPTGGRLHRWDGGPARGPRLPYSVRDRRAAAGSKGPAQAVRSSHLNSGSGA